jgi:hypothetical protein
LIYEYAEREEKSIGLPPCFCYHDFMTRFDGLAPCLLLPIALTGCVAWGYGLAPVEPPGRKILPTPTVESLQPTLAWEAAEPEEGPAVRYALIVYRTEGFPAKAIAVYTKEDIPGTSHTVERPLMPNTRYYWRVGIMRTNDRESYVDWNGYNSFGLIPYPIIFVGFQPGNAYSFDTPD